MKVEIGRKPDASKPKVTTSIVTLRTREGGFRIIETNDGVRLVSLDGSLFVLPNCSDSVFIKSC